MKKILLLGLILSSAVFAQWKQTSPISVNVVSLAVSDNGNLYAGTYYGSQKGQGIFRSTNGGESWINVSNGLPQSQNQYGEVVDIKAKGETVVILYRHPSSGGVTVYRSIDAGQTWAASNTGITVSLAELLETPEALFASGKSTIYRSNDFGITWTEVHKYQGFFDIDITGLLYNNGKIFASTPFRFSTDNGNTWTPSAIQANYIVDAFDIAAIDENTLIAGTTYGPYISTDNGETWSVKASGISGSYRIEKVAAHGNAAFVMAASSTAGHGTIYKSTDKGETWIKLTHGLPGDGTCTIESWVNAGSSVYAGIGPYGIFKSNDTGENWTTVNKGFGGVYNFNGIATNGKTILAATTGFALFRSTDEGETWLESSTGMAGSRYNSVFIQDSFALAGSTAGTSIYYSTDDGITWTAAKGNVNSNVKGFTNINDVYIAASDKGFFRSTDKGKNWELSNTGMTTKPNGRFLVKGDVIYAGGGNNEETIGGLFKSSDMGLSWSQVYADSINYPVSGIALYGNSIIITAGSSFILQGMGSVWRSDDDGSTFYRIDNGLPGEGYMPTGLTNAAGTMFTGSVSVWVRDLFATTDGGANWFSSSEGLQKDFSKVTSFAKTEQNVFVVLSGTGSYGIYKRPLSSLSTGITGEEKIPSEFKLEQNYPNPFNPVTNINFSLPDAANVTLKIYNSIGQEITNLLEKQLSPGTYNIPFNAAGLSSGVYFYRLQAGKFSETRKMILMK